ncbi:acyl carrier protein [Mycobacteroides abscessus]|uniref:acyl carrier protein n=1 Tax=Mycobacteroides abscessus TaxID=36809 RepID=UPI0021024D41|nr:acyl carrier protein [Mycobacteroides abscessus]
MNSDNSITPRVRDIIRSLSPINPADVVDSDRIIDDLGYDSVRAVELSVVLEMEFELRPITETEAIGMATVSDVIDLVEKLAAPDQRETARVTG